MPHTENIGDMVFLWIKILRSERNDHREKISDDSCGKT